MDFKFLNIMIPLFNLATWNITLCCWSVWKVLCDYLEYYFVMLLNQVVVNALSLIRIIACDVKLLPVMLVLLPVMLNCCL